MGSSGLVKISGCGRDADGVQAHLEYIDRRGKFDPIMETLRRTSAGRRRQ
jgi:hypothetical protein